MPLSALISEIIAGLCHYDGANCSAILRDASRADSLTRLPDYHRAYRRISAAMMQSKSDGLHESRARAVTKVRWRADASFHADDGELTSASLVGNKWARAI